MDRSIVVLLTLALLFMMFFSCTHRSRISLGFIQLFIFCSARRRVVRLRCGAGSDRFCFSFVFGPALLHSDAHTVDDINPALPQGPKAMGIMGIFRSMGYCRILCHQPWSSNFFQMPGDLRPTLGASGCRAEGFQSDSSLGQEEHVEFHKVSGAPL